jgi:tetratricopeptide (TPR) repeat protein
MTVAPVAIDWPTVAATIERLNRADPPAALAVASDWLAREQHAPGSEGHTRALRSHAHAVRSNGQYDAAILEYEEAEARFRQLGLDAEAARTEIGHVTALRFAGRYCDGLDLALRTRAYFLNRGDQLEIAKVANNLGTLYRPMGRLTDALGSYREALRSFRRLGDEWSTSAAEQNIGNVLVDLGRYQQALVHLKVAERIRRRLGLQSDRAQTLMNIGILSRQRGDYGYALAMLSEASRIHQELGDARSARVVDMELLPTCIALNLREESDAAAERAIQGMRRFEMPFELGKVLLAAAALAALGGERDQAAAHIDEALDIFGRLGNQVWQALARLQHARLALDAATGQPESKFELATAPVVDVDALNCALVECHEATDAFQAAGALDLAASGWLVEAAILGRLAEVGIGECSQALARYRDVLTAAASLNADHLLYQAHAAIGTLLHATDPDTAVESYRRAIDHLEAVRARARAVDLKLSFLSDKASLYERLVGLLVDRGSAESLADAYGYVERSKSRTLLEELLGGALPRRGGRRSRVARLAQGVRDLRARLNVAYVQAYNADVVPTSESVAGSGQAETIAALESALSRALRELQLAARAEARGGEVTPADTGVPLLPEGTALVEFYAVGSALLAFVVSDGGLHLRRIASLDRVSRLADNLSFQIGNMSMHAEYVASNLDRLRVTAERSLQQLYRAIVAPLEDVLTGVDRLVVVPHGPLHGLPFHAFHDGTGYLAERFTIAYAPSAGVYRAGLHGSGSIGDRMVVVGIDDPGLLWIGYELDAVRSAWPDATVLRGRKATERALRRRVGRIDALHLATHSVFRADNPAFSSVKLADSWLTVNDLAELAHGARLVTLSACESGVTGLSVGDEVLGLTRGLLAAGCSTIVASLWTVSDESTAHLMADFYRHLRAGSEPAAALRSSMLALRPKCDHPYYWAAFAVIGGGPGLGA